ncbi:MAG: hypothetical protein JWQ43_422, partial [Glaciihabitans sp.]|nr:hypothetical protein [Glaciihabitans sp.]
MKLSFTDVRDPELDVQTAAIDNGTFWMSGWIELRTPKGRRGNRMRLGRHIFVVRVPHAESFELDNPCGTSVLILEKVAQSLTTVCIDGILPCTAIVRTSHPSFV